MKAACLFALGLVCVTATYPTTYPFENESYVPPDMVPGTPNFTYDPETDTGGYAYMGMYSMNFFDGVLTDADFPYWPHANGYAWYCLVVVYAAPPALPGSVWNCTDKELVFSDADFLGVIDGKTICSAGNCCQQIIGKPKFGEDQHDWHSWATDRVAAALCDEMVEVEYCILVGGHFQTNCMEYYLSPEDRLVVFPCYDMHINFYMTCKVFTNVYAYHLLHEPPAYWDSLSVEDGMVADTATSLGDHVCNPYSYYFPSSSNSASSSKTSSESASSSTSSTTSSSESPASLTAISLAMVAAILVL